MKNTQTEGKKRLGALYKVSKLLSTFESGDITFPKIFAVAADVFPLLNVALIEHWDPKQKPKTTVWSSPDATREQVDQVTLKVRDIYTYFSGASVSQEVEIKKNPALLTELVRSSKTQALEEADSNNSILLPLLIDSLPPLGVLLIEGSVKLNEDDLEFANALADLISVALDRYHKTKQMSEKHEEKAKRSQKKILHAQQKVTNLEIQRELREAFVSLLSHDLGTPLQLILGDAENILLNPDDPESCKFHAERIIKTVNRAGQMTSDLLDANRIKSGETLSLNPQPLDAAALIKDVLDDFTGIYGNRFIFEGERSLEVVWDQGGVRRMIENLCNNAIKYGRQDTPIKISLKSKENAVIISVENQGEAISLEDHKYLFQQFRRGEKAQNDEIKGWGIGLTLVRGVSEAHGGEVTFKSEPDTGTIFTVTLPKDAKPFISKRKQN